METQGLLRQIYEEKKITDKFRIKEFVIIVAETYPQYISLQLSGDRLDLLDPYKIGDEIKVHFNIRGRAWKNKEGEEKYFNSLHAWRIERINSAVEETAGEPAIDFIGENSSPPPNVYNPEFNDMPF